MSTNAGYVPMNDTVVIGDDKIYTVRFSENGVPVDASTWDFFHTIKAAYTDSDDEALSSLNPSDMTFSNYLGTNDQLNFRVPKESTVNFPVGTLYQDLQVIRAGLVSTWGKGQVVAEAQVTERIAAP